MVGGRDCGKRRRNRKEEKRSGLPVPISFDFPFPSSNSIKEIVRSPSLSLSVSLSTAVHRKEMTNSPPAAVVFISHQSFGSELVSTKQSSMFPSRDGHFPFQWHVNELQSVIYAGKDDLLLFALRASVGRAERETLGRRRKADGRTRGLPCDGSMVTGRSPLSLERSLSSLEDRVSIQSEKGRRSRKKAKEAYRAQ